MNLAGERKRIDMALDKYRARLDVIPETLFTEIPPKGGWSYAEVYSHILQATLGSSIAAERCANNTCEPTRKGPSLRGRLMMLMGRFPPFRVKAPAEVTAKIPAEKISKEDAKNLLIKCRKRLDTTLPAVKSSKSKARFRHPWLGMLNAEQWFRFIRIHLEHHLMQLDRIAKSFQHR